MANKWKTHSSKSTYILCVYLTAGLEDEMMTDNSIIIIIPVSPGNDASTTIRGFYKINTT